MSKATATKPAADVARIKRAAAGHWPEILTTLAGIPADRLDGRHGPCPKCGGTDRFRALDDFRDTGAVFCNQCFRQGNGDGLAALQHFADVDFPAALRLVAEHVGEATATARPTRRRRTPGPARPATIGELDKGCGRFHQANHAALLEDVLQGQSRRSDPTGSAHAAVKLSVERLQVASGLDGRDPIDSRGANGR